MSDILWQEPPGRSGGTRRHDWAAIAEELKTKPGAWACIATCQTPSIAANTARNVRGGVYVAIREAGLFDAVARKVDGEYRVYARFTGERS